MEKYYAFKGEDKRIFTSWQECSEYMQGKKGYKYKAFSSQREAEAFLNDEDFYETETSKALADGYAVAYTDGSFFEELGAYSYGVVFISAKGDVKTFSGKGSREDFVSSRNIAGEVLGVLTAVKWAFINGINKLKIYHDYAGLAFWADRSWAAKSPISYFYVKELSKFSSALDIEFVKVKGHSNDKYNDMVDLVAKAALAENKELPLSPLNSGFKIGREYFKQFCERLHREAPFAAAEISGERVIFSYKDEKLLVSPMKTCVAVGGDGNFLYCLAASVAVAICGDMRKTENIISLGFDTDFAFEKPNETSAAYIADFLIKNKKCENFAPYIIFVLTDIADYLRKKLNVEKFSSLFEKTGERFYLTSSVEDKAKIEDIYNFFYYYRVNYFSLCLNESEVAEFLKKAEELLG